MMKVERSDNLLSIQLLRGIAAFMVVLQHSGLDAENYLGSNNIIRIISHHGWMGVEIFFIISGFIIPYSMFQKNYELSDFKIFFFKRIARIEPPYIISIALVLLLNWSNTWSAWYHGPLFQINWPNTLGHLGYLNAFTNQPWLNMAYWTLAIEFEYYIIVALLYPLIAHTDKRIMFGTYFMLLALTFVPFPLRTMHIPIYFPFFLIGIALFLFKCNKVNLKEFFAMIIPCLVVCYFIHGLTLALISIAVIFCIWYIKEVPKALLFLGTISYSLYLTHSLLISRFVALSGRYLKIQNLGLHIFLSICACLVFAWLFYLVIEKPFHKLSKKIKYTHKDIGGQTAH